MSSKKSPVRKTFFSAGLFLMAALFAVLGWAGTAGVVFLTLPFLLPRWLFFFSLFFAFTGTAVPFIWYLNRRFTPTRFPSEGILIREALETASLGVFLVWLQAGRLFTVFLGWAFFGAFLAVELLLRLYENSRWTPTPSNDEQTSEQNGEQTDLLPSGDSSAGE